MILNGKKITEYQLNKTYQKRPNFAPSERWHKQASNEIISLSFQKNPGKLPLAQFPPRTIVPSPLDNWPTDNCTPDNCPPDHYPPNTSHLGKLPPDNCT